MHHPKNCDKGVSFSIWEKISYSEEVLDIYKSHTKKYIFSTGEFVTLPMFDISLLIKKVLAKHYCLNLVVYRVIFYTFLQAGITTWKPKNLIQV